jgi:hypothetical protein
MNARIVGVVALLLGLVGVGWVAKTCTLAPPPDIAALLRERDSMLGVERNRGDSVRRENARLIDSTRTVARALDSAQTVARQTVQRLAGQVAGAHRQTDSVVALLSDSARRAVTLALGAEREAQRLKDSADAVADSLARLRLATEQETSARLVQQRERDSLRITALEGTVARLGQGLEHTRPRGLQPAGSVTYGLGKDQAHWVVGGTVRVPGTSWLRVGLHWIP